MNRKINGLLRKCLLASIRNLALTPLLKILPVPELAVLVRDYHGAWRFDETRFEDTLYRELWAWKDPDDEPGLLDDDPEAPILREKLSLCHPAFREYQSRYDHHNFLYVAVRGCSRPRCYVRKIACYAWSRCAPRICPYPLTPEYFRKDYRRIIAQRSRKRKGYI